jgi:hypothetical protein
MTLEQQIAVLKYRAASVQYTMLERRYLFREIRRLKKKLHKQEETQKK